MQSNRISGAAPIAISPVFDAGIHTPWQAGGGRAHTPSARTFTLRGVLRRVPATALLTLTTLLVVAAPALAHDGGQGWYGETNDKVVTNAGFILIIFFPVFIFLMSVIQWKLDKRKYRRMAAEKAATETPGGW